MDSKEIIKLNETYHQGDKVQKRIITPKNYTYRTLVDVLDRYIKREDKILDLGCGVGTLDFYLASKGNYVTGIDQSEIAVNMARRNSQVLGLDKNITYFRKNIFKFNTKKKFNDVLMLEVIEHLPDDDKAFVIARKLLNKNDLLFISTRSARAPLSRIGFTKKHDKRVGHLRRYTLEGLEKIVKSLGFAITYKSKTEGFSKELLFSYPKFGSPIVRIANRFALVSDLLNFFDNIFLKLFGESQLVIVARKK